jgi:hypothetical protein
MTEKCPSKQEFKIKTSTNEHKKVVESIEMVPFHSDSSLFETLLKMHYISTLKS